MVACRMSDIFTKIDHHVPVLLNEAIMGLNIVPEGIYVDATFGRGSHSQAILKKLNKQGRLIAFDKDLDAVQYAKQHFNDQRFSIFHLSFVHLQKTLEELNLLGKINGILFDLGVSSPQLENAERGFSFSRDGMLDMRMDVSKGISAASWIATVPEKELADILWKYGEEKFSRRIAKAIVKQREIKPIHTTGELAEIISRSIPKTKPFDKNPATRAFQAIRIFINNELQELPLALDQALVSLKVNGRLCVISFHSLEDRIVKQFLQQHAKGIDLPRGLPIKHETFKPKVNVVGKPIKPSLQEVNINPRARSAILRIAEKRS